MGNRLTAEQIAALVRDVDDAADLGWAYLTVTVPRLRALLGEREALAEENLRLTTNMQILNEALDRALAPPSEPRPDARDEVIEAARVAWRTRDTIGHNVRECPCENCDALRTVGAALARLDGGTASNSLRPDAVTYGAPETDATCATCGGDGECHICLACNQPCATCGGTGRAPAARLDRVTGRDGR
jgi:hypothetical protein